MGARSPKRRHGETTGPDLNGTGMDPHPEQGTHVRGLRKVVYVVLAVFFLALGLIGAVLPVLPTTPFLLLASYFSIRSSRWLHARITRLPVVGLVLEDWTRNGGVRPRVKVYALVMVAAVVGVTAVSQHLGRPTKVVVGLLAGCGAWVVWRLPTVDKSG